MNEPDKTAEIAHQFNLVNEARAQVRKYQELHNACYETSSEKITDIGLIVLPLVPVLFNGVCGHKMVKELLFRQAQVEDAFIVWLCSFSAALVVTFIVLGCSIFEDKLNVPAWRLKGVGIGAAIVFPVVVVGTIFYEQSNEEFESLPISFGLTGLACIGLLGDFLVFMTGSRALKAFAGINERIELRRLKRKVRREEDRLQRLQREQDRDKAEKAAREWRRAQDLRTPPKFTQSPSNKNEAAPFTNGAFKEEIPDRDDETNPKV